MQIEQQYWTAADGWQPVGRSGCGGLNGTAQLLLLFGAGRLLSDAAAMRDVAARYPNAILLGCSTAGEICDSAVRDDSLSMTAVTFEHSRLQVAQTDTLDPVASYAAGEQLARQLDPAELSHVFVLSDGLHVNGTDLARGLREHLPGNVAVTGGLAGDGDRFQQTLVVVGDSAREGRVAALGFYGRRLKVGYGSLGGWDAFGPVRRVTRSVGNVLYELDGQSALNLYKEYLGEQARGLPATALLFPLALRATERSQMLVRTVLGVDEQAGSMTFAGDIVAGGYAQLMKANFDRLIDGAAGAAQVGLTRLGEFPVQLALLVSCVGRKLVLKQRIEEEVEGVRQVLGEQAALAGFYSYGELCPAGELRNCELHNQTMTITAFGEL